MSMENLQEAKCGEFVHYFKIITFKKVISKKDLF